MFFTSTESKLGYQEVSHLFESLIKHGGNCQSQPPSLKQEEGKQPPTRVASSRNIEAFLMGE